MWIHTGNSEEATDLSESKGISASAMDYFKTTPNNGDTFSTTINNNKLITNNNANIKNERFSPPQQMQSQSTAQSNGANADAHSSNSRYVDHFSIFPNRSSFFYISLNWNPWHFVYNQQSQSLCQQSTPRVYLFNFFFGAYRNVNKNLWLNEIQTTPYLIHSLDFNLHTHTQTSKPSSKTLLSTDLSRKKKQWVTVQIVCQIIQSRKNSLSHRKVFCMAFPAKFLF